MTRLINSELKCCTLEVYFSLNMSFKKQKNKRQLSYLIFMHINTFLFLKNFLKLGYYRARLVYNLNKLMKKNGIRFNTVDRTACDASQISFYCHQIYIHVHSGMILCA